MSLILAAGRLPRRFEQQEAAAALWYGLVDYGEDNAATPGRHYRIAHSGEFDIAADTGGGFGWYIKASQNAGTVAQYMVSSGGFEENPSLNSFLAEASNPGVPSKIFVDVGDDTTDGEAGGDGSDITLDQVILVVVQYNASTGDWELYTCAPGSSAVLQDSNATPDGDIELPTDIYLGARSDLNTDRFWQEELGGFFAFTGSLSASQIAQLAVGTTSPVDLLTTACTGAWAFKDGALATEPDLVGDSDATRHGTWDSVATELRWKLDETSGSTAADAQGIQDGSYNNGVALGVPSMVDGDSGKAVWIRDGASVRIAHTSAFEADEWAVGCYVAPSVMPAVGGRMGLISKVAPGAAEFLLALINTSGELRVQAYTCTAAGVASWVGGQAGVGSLEVGKSYRIWLVQRSTGASIYIGDQEFGPNAVTTGIANNGGQLVAGGYLHASQGLLIPATACFDDLRFLARAPTPQEISAFAAAQDVLHLVDLGANIDEGEGSIDLSGHAHPSSGWTVEVVSDGEITDLTADGATLEYETEEVDENTSDSATVRLLKDSLMSRTATIALTVIDEAAGVSGEALSIPSFSEWLKSDETDPTPTLYVSNQNRGNGSGSSAANAKELQAALNSASAGDVLLAVCQTPGTVEFWDYPSGIIFPSGSSGNPVTLQARQGDGVVISAGEAYAGARTTNSGFWTQSGLSSADIAKKIWRSTSTFSGGDDNMMGWWVEFDHPHQIVRAGNMATLRAAYSSADSKPDGSGGYCGPCVHQASDGRIYIRFQRPHTDKYSAGGTWSRNVWPDNAEAVNGSGQMVYPISEDPNDYEIYLTAKVNHSDGPSAFRSTSSAGGHFKIGSGINSVGYRLTFGSSNHDVTARRGLHWAWLAAITGTGANPAFNFDLQRARFTDGSKIHLARADWKFGGWLESIRSVFLGSSEQNAVHDIYCKNCTIADYHELVVLNRFCESIRFRNCALFHIYDDGFQCRHDLSRVEIGYCYARGCCPWGGMGESGTDGDDPDPGNWFIHHNIVDMREERNSDWRTQPHPHYPALPHSPDGDSPRKIYNNLLLYGPDQEEEAGPGFAHCGAEPAQNNATAFCHEIFNNIVVRVSWSRPGTTSQRYDPTAIVPPGSFGYSRLFRDQTDYVMERVNYSANQSNELWDYNCYYKDVQSPVDGLLRKYRAGQSDGPDESYATLAAWKASASFSLSKNSGSRRSAYSPGFEGNSTDSKPTMAALDDFPASRFLYRPSATSVVTVAASSSLSGENWWSTAPDWGGDYFDWDGLEPDAWKGALDPNGSTLPVGVQSP